MNLLLIIRYIKHMGPVGSWSQRDIDRLVLPTAGEMESEVEIIDDTIVENVVLADLNNDNL